MRKRSSVGSVFEKTAAATILPSILAGLIAVPAQAESAPKLLECHDTVGLGVSPQSSSDPSSEVSTLCEALPGVATICELVSDAETDLSDIEAGTDSGPAHCYRVKCPKSQAVTLDVTDRFGTRTVRALRAKQVCSDESEATFTCYKVADPTDPTDPSEASGAIVTRDADGEIASACHVIGPATRLCLSDAVFEEPSAQSADESADESAAATTPSTRLCYPVDCLETPDARATGDSSPAGPTSRLCFPATLPGFDGDMASQDDAGLASDSTDTPEPPLVFGPSEGCGDANGNGAINASDALIALQTSVGIGSGCGACACDVNDSGGITATDALVILQYSVNLPTELICPDGPFDVLWDGGGDGQSWHDPANWSDDGVPRYCNRVLIDVAEDPTVTYRSGTLSVYSLSAGDNLTVASGALTLRNASSVGASLVVTGGTLEASAEMTIADMTWSGGTLKGSGTFIVTDTLTLDTTQKNLTGVTLENRGTATWSLGNIFIGSDATLRNTPTGTVDITANVSALANGGASNLFDNQGTLTRSAGDGMSQVGIPFESSGSVDIATGTFALIRESDITGPVTVAAPATLALSGTAHTLQPAASLSGQGDLALQGGTNSLAPSYSLTGEVRVTGGISTFDAVASIPRAVVTGGTLGTSSNVTITDMAWSGGTLNGSGTFIVTDTLTLDTTQKNLSSVTLENRGTATWSLGNILIGSDATLRNTPTGTVDITANVSALLNGGASNLFDNQGALTRSAGDGEAFFSVPLNNSGSIHIQTGTVRCSSGYTQTSAGSLTTDARGNTLAEMSRLIGNVVVLDGELVINPAGGYTPQVGDSITVLEYTTRVGEFATLTGTDLGGGVTLVPNYIVNQLFFNVTQN